MIGVNVVVSDILVSVRVFRFRSLIFRAFTARFVVLAALVLDPDFYARLECFLGRPT
jgi:hypothetical protein